VIGVRYTTSRGVAERALNLVFRKLGRRTPKSVTAMHPIYGGRIERFAEFQQAAIEHRPTTLTPSVMQALVHNHGSAYTEVLQYLDDPRWGETLDTSTVLKAEVVHAVRKEMAQKLADVVFRRTDLGTGGYPGALALEQCAEVMASELGWTENHARRELDEVMRMFPSHIAAADHQVRRPPLSLA
jgi:glycerol-3-phosphate dehydrogenase